MMPRGIFTLAAPFLLFLLTGCSASLPATMGGDCQNKTLPALLDATDLKPLFQGVASELCDQRCRGSLPTDGPAPLCDEKALGGSHPTVMVTDFADLQSFLPSQPGLLMGELMRSGLNDVCCYKVSQAEFGKYFKLSENGLVVLTRQAAEIKKKEFSQPEAIVGTYTYLNNNKVLIFARRINTDTGIISKMVTKEITYSCGGRSVLGYTVK